VCTVAFVTEPAPRKQRHIALILARDLAANLATAMLVADAEGELVFFNEPAELILGRPFAEAQMTTADLARAFRPVDEAGRPIPASDLPLATAFRTGIPSRGAFWIDAADGRRPHLEVVGVPLFAHTDQLVGGLAVFWERAEEA
jgi:PAS domain-containing protein